MPFKKKTVTNNKFVPSSLIIHKCFIKKKLMDEDISFDKEIVEHFNHKYLEIKQISEHLKSRCQVHRMPNDYFF